jgi:hypothetical protein
MKILWFFEESITYHSISSRTFKLSLVKKLLELNESSILRRWCLQHFYKWYGNENSFTSIQVYETFKMDNVVNIPSDVDDIYYCYKMPRIIVKIEGRGNGIRTIISNLKRVELS